MFIYKLRMLFSRHFTNLHFIKNRIIPEKFEAFSNGRTFKLVSTLSHQGPTSSSNRLDILHLKRLDLSICCKHTTSQSKLLDERKSLDYEVIYLIDRLRTLRTICRLAKFTTICATVGAPSILGIGYMGIFSMQIAHSVALILTLYATFFLGPAILISNVVGKIMISRDLSYLKISHLSIFGNRRDIYLSVDDMTPLQQSEMGILSRNVNILQFRNVPKKFIFLPQSGDINAYHDNLLLLLNGELSSKKKGEQSKL